MPALTMEMLRVVTRAGAILVRTDEAGVRAVAVPGLEVPTDGNGQFWVHFNKHDPARYRIGRRCAQRRGRRPTVSRPAGADRHLGDRPPRHQDHAGRAGDARRRGPRPDPRKRADPGAAGAPQLCDRRPNLSLRSCFGLAIIIAAPMLPASIVIALGALLIAAIDRRVAGTSSSRTTCSSTSPIR